MPAAGELALQERSNAGLGDLGADDPGTHRQDVRVVVLTAEARRHRVGRLDAADAAHLVRHDRLAGPAPAEHDPALEVATRHRPGDRRDEVGIVDGGGVERAEVAVLDPQLVEQGAQLALEVEAGMVGADRDAHLAVECRRQSG